ncbi:hypothetical protein BV898_17975 [Hypsibius exemplaris]|uniref:G-protein coupled receptors family 1 profile domain-containing protein n=1 Tax=Hypsibius exemplaris TaxID=2072580 RepID=A0A9X6NGI6_HYPEX|nr:hypothetical protein BV898_17975 [Hypsibius exemplaris]
MNHSVINDSFGLPSINQTASSHAEWSALPVIILITFFTGLIGNGALLIIFLTHRSLWTPFHVYVMNLLTASCCCIATQFPLDVYVDLYGGQWLLGERTCSYYIIVSWYFQAVIFNSHQLIAINRIWAVSHPISYRRIHSIPIAICLCVCVWLYVFAFLSPALIRDSLYFRRPADGPDGCQFNTPLQLGWAVAIQIVIYICPQMTMVLALVIIILAKRTRRRRRRIRKRANSVAPSTGNGANHSQRPTVMKSVAGAEGSAVVQHQEAHPQRSHHLQQPRPIQQSHGDLLLILLTISVLICWTPNNVYFSWLFFEPLDAPAFYATTTILVAFQATVDPIMLTFALGRLRTVLHQSFLCHR